MLRLFERYQTAIVIAAVVLFPLLVYRANARRPADAHAIDRVLLAASKPIQSGLNAAVGGISDLWHEYVAVIGARRENGELRRRVLRAERERGALQAVTEENAALRRLMKLEELNPELSPLYATVIAMGSSPLSRSVEIDKGGVDGIERGMAVVADEGLVGLVMRVGWTSAEVLLIADEKISVWSRVARSRASGRIKGSGMRPAFGLELNEVLRSDDIRPGDHLVTSGMGGVFPVGIPIGEIKEVRTPTGSQHRVADIEPYVDFARLEHVAVLLGTLPEGRSIVTPSTLLPTALRVESSTPAVQLEDAGTADAGVAGASGRLDGGR